METIIGFAIGSEKNTVDDKSTQRLVSSPRPHLIVTLGADDVCLLLLLSLLDEEPRSLGLLLCHLLVLDGLCVVGECEY